MSDSPETSRGARKERVGYVVSDKMDKTIVVRVDRRVRHAKFEKVMTLASRFYAHDEKNEAKQGDTVEVESTRPLSRLKRWRLVKVLVRATDLSGLQVKEVEVPGKVKKEPAAAGAAKAGKAEKKD